MSLPDLELYEEDLSPSGLLKMYDLLCLNNPDLAGMDPRDVVIEWPEPVIRCWLSEPARVKFSDGPEKPPRWWRRRS